MIRRGIKPAEKRDIFKRLAAGEIDVVIGTHVLVEEKTEFKNLGLVVIDEQHRFGVVQRPAIDGKRKRPQHSGDDGDPDSTDAGNDVVWRSGSLGD